MLHKIESNPKINHPLACTRKPNKHSQPASVVTRSNASPLPTFKSDYSSHAVFQSHIVHLHYLFFPSHNP
jgi:hypothetical protein